MHVLVVVRDGPASERGWLGARLAMALALGGHRVAVYLYAESAGWAVPVDVRAWMGGDPAADLEGLTADAGVSVLVDDASLLAVTRGDPERRRPGVEPIDPDTFTARYGAADWVVVV